MKKDNKEKVLIEVKGDKVKMQFGTGLSKIEMEFDENDKIWMIVKADFNGEEMLTLARDIDGSGWLDDNEIRMDNEHYTEEDGEKRIQELSKELGIRAMTSEDFWSELGGILGNKKNN